jgi:hypothetical protein
VIEQAHQQPVPLLKMQAHGFVVTEASGGWGRMFWWARLCWGAWTWRREAPPRYFLAE